MEALCFANLAQPPEAWVLMHSLLQRGLSALPPCANASKYDIQWFCWVMARLHLNCFRVDTVQPVDMRSDPAALLKAAAAAMAGGTQGAPSGTAVYALGSMFNHSCEPNTDVVFPRNNHQVSFVAATDISKHTELTISYIDTTLDRASRQHALAFAYGFECKCVRCKEEE